MKDQPITPEAALKVHVEARRRLDRVVAAGDADAFAAARAQAVAADRAYRADLLSRGFAAPHGVGAQ
jgi:hypothetical protein